MNVVGDITNLARVDKATLESWCHFLDCIMSSRPGGTRGCIIPRQFCSPTVLVDCAQLYFNLLDIDARSNRSSELELRHTTRDWKS